MAYIAIFVGILVSLFSKMFHLGAGATWPGEIALRIDKKILRHLSKKVKKGVIIVAGTNGKTTTTRMIRTILEKSGATVLTNESGANLHNGIVSAFLVSPACLFSPADYAIFEVDENSVPIVCTDLTPKIIILLNLFRDQLDRYGEVDSIVNKWKTMLTTLPKSTRLILNADDPGIAFVGHKSDRPIDYFGIETSDLFLPSVDHATDSIYCPVCGKKLAYGGTYYSHLGKWACGSCGFTHPVVSLSGSDVTPPIPGVYNISNTLAATLTCVRLGMTTPQIESGMASFTPAFGRMEEVLYQGKHLRVLLSKNPTGFNESLRAVLHSEEVGPILISLNDRIPDGRDISWIWDVDFEQLTLSKQSIVITGDRAYDMGIRIKHATNGKLPFVEPVTEKAIETLLGRMSEGQTAWILATYSAMLDIRKIVTGHKIL